MEGSFLTTRAAAELLGVGTTSVKRWADSGLLPCVRTPGGHRRFSREAVESLLYPALPRNDDESWDVLVDSWLARLAGDAAIDELLADLRGRYAELGAWWRVAGELASVLAAMGERWRAGRLSILKEHIVSERLARVLARAADQIPVPVDAPVALLLVANGEEHTLGLSLLEVCLREAGYAARWTGRRTPIELLGAHLAQSDVALVAVSASAGFRDRAALAAQATQLSDACDKHGVRLLLGGQGPWPDLLPHGERVSSFEHLNYVLAADNERGETRGLAS